MLTLNFNFIESTQGLACDEFDCKLEHGPLVTFLLKDVEGHTVSTYRIGDFMLEMFSLNHDL